LFSCWLLLIAALDFCSAGVLKGGRHLPKTPDATFDSVVKFLECAIDEIASGARPLTALTECSDEALETSTDKSLSLELRGDVAADNSAATKMLERLRIPVTVTIDRVFFFAVCLNDGILDFSNCISNLSPNIILQSTTQPSR